MGQTVPVTPSKVARRPGTSDKDNGLWIGAKSAYQPFGPPSTWGNGNDEPFCRARPKTRGVKRAILSGASSDAAG